LTASVETDSGRITRQRRARYPQLGWFQIEERTYRDAQRLYGDEFDFSDRAYAEVEHDQELGVRVAYAVYLMKLGKRKLPDARNMHELAKTWKRFYNTRKGLGTVRTAMRKYQGHAR